MFQYPVALVNHPSVYEHDSKLHLQDCPWEMDDIQKKVGWNIPIVSMPRRHGSQNNYVFNFENALCLVNK
jgi:hypothetical protein